MYVHDVEQKVENWRRIKSNIIKQFLIIDFS